MRIIRLPALVLPAVLLAGVAAAAFGVSVAGSSEAGAATGTATALSLRESPASGDNPPNLANPSISLDGTLADAQSGTGIATPETVTITEQVGGAGPAVTLPPVTTDGSGDFAVTLQNVTAGGVFTASFAGDAANGYAASASFAVHVYSGPVASPVIALTAAPRPQVAPGTTVTFAGTAYLDENGAKVPPPDAVATLVHQGNPTTVKAPLSASGAFTLSFKPTGNSGWSVQVGSAIPPGYQLYLSNATKPVAIDAVNVYPTRVAALTVPATHEVHSPVKVTGTVQAKAGSAWKPAASVAVAYYYRVLPKGKWVHVANGKTNAHGTFGWQSSLVKFGHLQWQVKVAKQQTGSTVYQASNSAVKTSHFVDRSYVTHFAAMHLYGATSLAAIMQDYPASAGITYAKVSGTAKFYYLPKGSKTWRYLGSSRTDGNGGVAIEPGGTLRGTFKIVFAAQGNFLGSTAKQSLG